MIHELKAGVLHYYVVVLYKELLFLRAKYLKDIMKLKLLGKLGFSIAYVSRVFN